MTLSLTKPSSKHRIDAVIDHHGAVPVILRALTRLITPKPAKLRLHELSDHLKRDIGYPAPAPRKSYLEHLR